MYLRAVEKGEAAFTVRGQEVDGVGLGRHPTHSFSNLIGSSLTMSCALIGREAKTWAELAASSGFVSPSGRIFPRRHKRISPADQQDLHNSELGICMVRPQIPNLKAFFHNPVRFTHPRLFLQQTVTYLLIGTFDSVQIRHFNQNHKYS